MRAVLLAVLLMAPLPASALDWQLAISQLARERTRAETCARIFTRLVGDDPIALSRGDLAYSDAKADMDGVIAGLVVAVTQDAPPTDRAHFEDLLASALTKRDAFCDDVVAMVPPDAPTKDVWQRLLGTVIDGTIDAVVDLWLDGRQQAREVRETLRVQIEAERWPAFGSVRP